MVFRCIRVARGIIPAYAGNTRNVIPHVLAIRDHPRVCGEHLFSGVTKWVSPGSSPRMRGTPCLLRLLIATTGIIPAYAGNTYTLRRVKTLLADHPRVCGEHKEGILPPAENPGSSPRMRGTPFTPHRMLLIAGIIPAYAGNTGCLDTSRRP